MGLCTPLASKQHLHLELWGALLSARSISQCNLGEGSWMSSDFCFWDSPPQVDCQLPILQPSAQATPMAGEGWAAMKKAAMTALWSG